MTENKTKATDASVESYLSGIVDESRRKDCEDVSAMLAKATNEQPKMWGTSIVGFGIYRYKYESGREGETPLAGFASRKGDITLYLESGFPGREKLLAKLGKHKTGKGCLYIRKLSDVDRNVLEQLIVDSVAERKRQHA
jgi:hypothetical protein